MTLRFGQRKIKGAGFGDRVQLTDGREIMISGIHWNDKVRAKFGTERSLLVTGYVKMNADGTKGDDTEIGVRHHQIAGQV